MSKTAEKNIEKLIKKMPKAEIHVHLEGAITPETIWSLAEKNGVKLPVASLAEWRKYYDFKDFNHFIEVYLTCTGCMRSPEDFAFLVEEFHKYQAGQNILYTEAFISASMLIGKMDFTEVFEALAEGARKGQEKYKVRVKFIPDIARQLPETQAEVLKFTKMGFDRGLFLGLGLGGLEQGFPPELFTDTFAKARGMGMHVVAHAGEAAGPESIMGAIQHLGAERIGHGVQCLKDARTVDLLRDKQIPIEVCPVSNYRTKVVDDGEPHPIHEMIDEGLYCTLNSDDPTMFSTSLTGEYLFLLEQGMEWDDLWLLNKNTLDAAFLSPTEKSTLQKQWDAFETEFAEDDDLDGDLPE